MGLVLSCIAGKNMYKLIGYVKERCVLEYVNGVAIKHSYPSKSVGIVSNDISTFAQAKLQFQHDLGVEIDDVKIYKMDAQQELVWAMDYTRTKEFKNLPFIEKMHFLQKYNI